MLHKHGFSLFDFHVLRQNVAYSECVKCQVRDYALFLVITTLFPLFADL